MNIHMTGHVAYAVLAGNFTLAVVTLSRHCTGFATWLGISNADLFLKNIFGNTLRGAVQPE